VGQAYHAVLKSGEQYLPGPTWCIVLMKTRDVKVRNIAASQKQGAYTRSSYSSTRATSGHIHGLSWDMWPPKQLKLS